MTLSRRKVLVLGSDTRSFLTVIRSLGRAGKEVHVAWFARDSVSVSSKYVNKLHRITRPPTPGWKSELRSLLEREQYDLVVPCNDPSILPLHGERREFADYPIYLVDETIFDAVMDKASISDVARRSGIRLANEVVIRSPAQCGLLESLTAPYVIKPTMSYVAERLAKKNHVVIEQDVATAQSKIKEILKSTPVAVQEFFEGHGVGVEFIAKQGEVLCAFQHARLHEPPRGGGSSYRKSCKLNDELHEATRELVKTLGYTGIGMAEFRYNSRSRDWVFVELNSRFWGSLPLAVACGADFPRYLFEMCCEGARDFQQDYRVNRTARNWLLDLKWLRLTFADNGFSPLKQLRQAGQLLGELRFPLTLRESSDVLCWDDPAPGIRELKELVAAGPRKLRRKLATLAARIGPIREYARNRMRKRLANANSVLFICKGNICRSPFAAQYAKLRMKQFHQVASTGYFPKQNRPSPDNAQVAASEYGVDLSVHRSSVISPEAVDQADAILVFDEENRVEVGSAFPQARSKTFMLGILGEADGLEIIDPYGGSVEDFRAVYSSIKQAIDHLANGAGQTSS